MNCPNCGNEMKPINLFIMCQTDPDESYYIEVGEECKKCKISYKSETAKWDLPENLQPTEKQLNAEKIIKRLYHCNDQPITRKQYSAFIKKYYNIKN